MIIINNINLPLDFNFDNLKDVTAKELKCNKDSIKSALLYRKSVDARKKDNVHFCCSVLADLTSDEALALKKCKNAIMYNKKEYVFKKADKSSLRPIIIGFGPAGMFAALTLAKAGLNPIVFERGSSVDQRQSDVEDFMNGGNLNTDSNVQFGEGGAGTFSDGKLNTGIKDLRCRTVLEIFNKFGAPQKILYDAKPHVGTDILINIVKNIRKEIISLGGEIDFNSKLENINIENNSITSITVSGKEIECKKLIIATGHSARDTFKMLNNNGIQMAQKPFAIGVRIEHLQKDINYSLYGKFADNKALGAADYKLAAHLPDGRGVYTFCMCPGGEVINSSSEENRTAVNGMSYSKRNGLNSNSAVLVGINTTDFPSSDVLAGCLLQEKIEESAYKIGKGKVPITTVDNFLNNKPFKITKVYPTIKPDFIPADFSTIFPDYISESLKKGIKIFGNKISAFKDGSAILTAPETRSSSPVRILRNEELESNSVNGLYPCGEGSGYAGGIVSSAVDGMKCAEMIIDKSNIVNKSL